MSRLRLGVVGCGDIAGYTALFARLNRGVWLAACCDARLERASVFARRWGIPRAYSGYAEMLAAGDLDAVYLAVPHHLHAPMIAQALERGLHVFTEKPLARTLEEGRAIAALIRPDGPRVAVNYQYRYDSACYALARAVQRGELGEVRYARINIPWKRGPEYFSAAPWHASLAQAGGGTLLTQGSHFLDVVLWACGQPVKSALGRTARRVFAAAEVEDLAMGILELEGGALVEICSSMVAAKEGAPVIEVYGSRATAAYRGGALPHLKFTGRRIRAERPPVPGIHALQRSLEGFRRWAAGGEPHLVPAGEALAVLAAVEGVYGRKGNGDQETGIRDQETGIGN